ncbi:hypothetical protein, partial [Anaerosporobacter sp.]
REMERPSCGSERPRREYTRPRSSYEMPSCENVKPSCGCEQKAEMVENIFIINDCSCQEFMRINDLYNCTFDKANRELMDAVKNLSDAMESIVMGLCYSDRANEISSYINEFLGSMEESDSSDNQPTCPTMRCTCNQTCNNSCTQMVNPCMQMREDLNELICTLNDLEKEGLEHTKEALDKLMDAKELRKCIGELKSKVAKNCYPKC